MLTAIFCWTQPSEASRAFVIESLALVAYAASAMGWRHLNASIGRSIAAQARLLRVFAAGDWRAKRGLKAMSPRRDRKSETTTREKWPQKRLFC